MKRRRPNADEAADLIILALAIVERAAGRGDELAGGLGNVAYDLAEIADLLRDAVRELGHAPPEVSS